jgi:hypothetical protein
VTTPYRSEVEALEARLASINAELGKQTQERDVLAQMLAEARTRDHIATAHVRAMARRRWLLPVAATGGVLAGIGGLFAITMLFRGPSKTEAVLQKLDEYADRMCVCTDKACADKVNDDLTKWATEMAKDNEDRPDIDTTKRAEVTVKRYADCMMKAMNVTP